MMKKGREINAPRQQTPFEQETQCRWIEHNRERASEREKAEKQQQGAEREAASSTLCLSLARTTETQRTEVLLRFARRSPLHERARYVSCLLFFASLLSPSQSRQPHIIVSSLSLLCPVLRPPTVASCMATKEKDRDRSLDAYRRMNFLFQAAHVAVAHSNQPALSRFYARTLKRIASRLVLSLYVRLLLSFCATQGAR